MASEFEIPTQIEGVIAAEVDGEQVLLNPVDLSYLGLNATAAIVWGLIDGQRSVAEIAEQASSQFSGDPAVMKSECRNLIDALSSARLITTGAL